MAQDNVNKRNDYNGDDATSSFSITFPFLSNSGIKVVVKEISTGEETLLALTTDYELSGAGAENGGTLTLVDDGQAWLDVDGDLSSDYTISILPNNALTQEEDIANSDLIYLDEIEAAVNRQNILIKQLQEQIDRCLKTQGSEAGTSALTQLPSVPDRAGKVLSFNDDGEPVTEAPSAASASDETPEPPGTADPGDSEEYARADHVHERLDDVVNIPMVFGGVGSELTTDMVGDIEVPFDCTIQRCTLVGDQTGSVVLGIAKSSYANFDTMTSIVAAAPPTISSAKKSQDSTLTDWTVSVTAGDILRFTISSVSDFTSLSVNLKAQRTS